MKRIFLSLFIAIIVAGLLWAGYYNYLSGKDEKKLLDQKISILESEVSDLRKSMALSNTRLNAVSGQQAQTGVAVQELQNRQAVEQKSQSELLTATVAKTAPSVVSIVISKDVPKLSVTYVNPFGDDPFFQNFDIRVPVYQQQGTEHQTIGAGSGFLVSRNGYIVTNRHVVADEAADYTVLLANGKQLPASVVYRDPSNDMAVIKVEGTGFGYVNLGDSGSLALGQTIVAIGNALGEFNNSVSVGIISGLNRTIEASGEKLSGVIQTDAAINPGNSGGPLLNLSGEVVGINVATVIGSNNISFSIPINAVKNTIRSVVNK